MFLALVNRDEALREPCPICGKAALVTHPAHDVIVLCPICGLFGFNLGVQTRLMELLEMGLGYRLSHRLRINAEQVPAANRINKKSYDSPTYYSATELESYAKTPDLPTKEKLGALLNHLARISEFPGDTVLYTETDFAVMNAKNPSEAEFYIETLIDQKLVEAVVNPVVTVKSQLERRFGNEKGRALKVSSAGWLEVDRERQEGAQSAHVFIAMWFDKQKDDAHHSIRAAIERSGYLPQRLDEHLHVNRIDDEIIAQLRRSKFLVADLTDQNNGAYFEAGFMLGMGRPVVWICDKGKLDRVHFDTRQYSTIDYEDLPDLEKRLQNKIEALFGDGPYKGKMQ